MFINLLKEMFITYHLAKCHQNLKLPKNIHKILIILYYNIDKLI